MELGELLTEYLRVFEFEAPRTLSKKWLYNNIAYETYCSGSEEPNPVSMSRRIMWADMPTPEEAMAQAFKKLTKAQLKALCNTHEVKYDDRDRATTVQALVNALAEVEDLFDHDKTPKQRARTKRDSTLAERGVTKPRAKRHLQDSLPDSIGELLELKKSAAPDMQRRIRRKMRSINPNWKKELGNA